MRISQTLSDGWQSLRRYDYRKGLFAGPFTGLLVVLLMVDGLAILTDVIATFLKDYNPDLPKWLLWNFRLDVEFSVWAVFGYLKLIAISVLMWLCYRRTGLVSFLLLFLVYFYTTLDDMFTLHEQAGRVLGAWTSTNFAVGETLYFVIVGVFIVSILYRAVSRATKTYHSETWLLAVGLLGIGFFAAFINMIEGLLTGLSRSMLKVFSLIDDGGEMVVSSVIVVLALIVYAKISAATTPAPSPEIVAN